MSKLNKETQERIKADAEAATNDHAKNLRTYDMEYARMIARLFGYKEGYIAGATAVHDRAQVLVDALEAIEANSEHPGIKSFAAKALEQWKGKEVEDENSH